MVFNLISIYLPRYYPFQFQVMLFLEFGGCNTRDFELGSVASAASVASGSCFRCARNGESHCRKSGGALSDNR